MSRLPSILLFFILTSAAVRADQGASLSDDEGIASRTSSLPSGLRVFLDPVTKQIVNEPSTTRMRQLGNASAGDLPRRSSHELHRFFLRGGGQGVFLDGWADHQMTIHRSKSGQLRLTCSQNDEHGQSITATRPEPTEITGETVEVK